MKMELPKEIKKEYKDCHEEFNLDINNYSQSIDIRIGIKKRNNLIIDGEIDKINKLDSETNFKNSSETCKKAEENMWKILESKGIQKIDK